MLELYKKNTNETERENEPQYSKKNCDRNDSFLVFLNFEKNVFLVVAKFIYLFIIFFYYILTFHSFLDLIKYCIYFCKNKAKTQKGNSTRNPTNLIITLSKLLNILFMKVFCLFIYLFCLCFIIIIIIIHCLHYILI